MPPDFIPASPGFIPEVAQPTSVPCVLGPKQEAHIDADTGMPYFAEKDAFYIQDYEAKWLRFAPDVSSGSVKRALNQTALWSADGFGYVHPMNVLPIALVFGWPVGFGIWAFYRIVRFAVQG